MHRVSYEDFDYYQDKASDTAIYPPQKGLEYVVLGLANEAGEVAGVLKKLLRDENGIPGEEFVLKIRKECGDVLWYLAMIHDELGISLATTAKQNIEKLQDRKDRGVLQGSGDDR